MNVASLPRSLSSNRRAGRNQSRGGSSQALRRNTQRQYSKGIRVHAQKGIPKVACDTNVDGLQGVSVRSLCFCSL